MVYIQIHIKNEELFIQYNKINIDIFRIQDKKLNNIEIFEIFKILTDKYGKIKEEKDSNLYLNSNIIKIYLYFIENYNYEIIKDNKCYIIEKCEYLDKFLNPLSMYLNYNASLINDPEKENIIELSKLIIKMNKTFNNLYNNIYSNNTKSARNTFLA